MTEPKPKRPKKYRVERFEEKGSVVELREVPPDRRDAPEGDHMFGPATRSKWEIHVDGVHRGYLYYPLGVSNPWAARILEPDDLWTYGDETIAWGEPNGQHGGWKKRPWDGTMGFLAGINPLQDESKRGVPIAEGDRPFEDYQHRFWDRESIARAFVDFTREGRAPNYEEVLERFKEAREVRASRAAKKKADDARYEQERIEREAERERQKLAAEQLRKETVEGLESIRDRLRGQLNNHETDALIRAIVHYGGSEHG